MTFSNAHLSPLAAANWEVTQDSGYDDVLEVLSIAGRSDRRRSTIRISTGLVIECRVKKAHRELSMTLCHQRTMEFSQKNSLEISRVRHRLDSGPIKKSKWKKAETFSIRKFDPKTRLPDIHYAALYSYRGMNADRSALQFIRSMMGHETLYLEIDLIEIIDAVEIFDLTGFDEAAKMILDKCDASDAKP